MSTNWINLKGKVSWAKPYEPEEFSGDTRWIINFYPFDDREWDKFNKSGLQQVPKEDHEGEKFVRFRRNVKKIFPKDDEVTKFTPPKISGAFEVKYVDKNTGKEVKSYKKSDGFDVQRVGDEIAIGNGSVCLINIAVYNTSQGKGHRWESIKVLDLVPYDPDNPEVEVEIEDDIPEDIPEKIVRDKPVKAKAEIKEVKTEKEIRVETKPNTIKEDMNDEIPW